MVRISIIIPSYNEAKYIGETLRSIRDQEYKDFEVILADNGSTDGTAEIARKAYGKVIVIHQPERGVCKAYNAAVKVAKGELLMFLDADTSVTKGLLQAYDTAFQDKGVVAATGPILPLEGTTWTIRTGFKLISVHLAKLFIKLNSPSTISSNLMVSKAAYLKVGGFNESMNTYYDWDLSNRIKRIGRVVFVDGAIAKTSVRRVKKWGMLGYFAFHTGNVVRYNLFHKPKEEYDPIR